MLGLGQAKAKRKPDYEIGQIVPFHIYFGYGYTLCEGEIVEHIGPREYIIQRDDGARFVVRVDKNGELASGGAN